MKLPCLPLFLLQLFFNLHFRSESCDAGNVPALVWTSREYGERPRTVSGRIGSPVFKSYLLSFLENRPLVIVFLEQFLEINDFVAKSENGYNNLSLLNNVTFSNRFAYLEDVESPYEVLENLTRNTFGWKQWKADEDLEEATVRVLEFQEINGSRVDGLKVHYDVIARIYESVNNLSQKYICIYTAKKGINRDLSHKKAISPWHRENESKEARISALSAYTDAYTGFTLLVRGTIQLYVPTLAKTHALINLDSPIGAWEKGFNDKIHFVVRFTNYTLTFCTNRTKTDLVIDKIKITNDNGDSLNLLSKTIKEPQTKRKCVNKYYEYESLKKPLVKVKLTKYKFLRLSNQGEVCTAPYNPHVISSLMFFSFVTVAIFWNSLLRNKHFQGRNKIYRISPDTLLKFKSNNVTSN